MDILPVTRNFGAPTVILMFPLLHAVILPLVRGRAYSVRGHGNLGDQEDGFDRGDYAVNDSGRICRIAPLVLRRVCDALYPLAWDTPWRGPYADSACRRAARRTSMYRLGGWKHRIRHIFTSNHYKHVEQ